MSQNDGSVEVRGDGCHVVVKRGSGVVVYVGDGGYLEVGPEVVVDYSGAAGRVERREKATKQRKTKTGVINVLNENGRMIEAELPKFCGLAVTVPGIAKVFNVA